MAANDLVLSFGCCSFSQAYDVNNLTVSVSQDEGANFTQLPIASDARPANKKWAQVSVTEGIPKTKNLVIRFDWSRNELRNRRYPVENTVKSSENNGGSSHRRNARFMPDIVPDDYLQRVV